MSENEPPRRKLTPEEQALANSMRELVERANEYGKKFELPLARLRREERIGKHVPRRGTGGFTDMEAYRRKKGKGKSKKQKPT